MNDDAQDNSPDPTDDQNLPDDDQNLPDDGQNLPDDIQDRIDKKEEEEGDDSTKSPSVQDEEWQEGTTMDDDVDELGEDIFGKGYKDTEEIDITKKYKPTSDITPPEPEGNGKL